MTLGEKLKIFINGFRFRTKIPSLMGPSFDKFTNKKLFDEKTFSLQDFFQRRTQLCFPNFTSQKSILSTDI